MKKNKRRTVFVNAKPTVTMAAAAPIDMKNFPEIDKSKKKAEPAKKHDVPNDPPADIKAWKEGVMTAVEAVLDAAIKEMANA